MTYLVGWIPTKHKIQLFFILFLAITGVRNTLRAQAEQIVPVSPEASALAKMVNYPVNLNTGIPDINIPLHEIQVGDLKIPLTLEYHAGGFKINERSTRVGLGWSLSIDQLQITRTINGMDDLSQQGYLNNNLMNAYPAGDPYSDYSYPLRSGHPHPYANAYDLAFGNKDGMPDKFHYRLLGKSGSFYFRKNDSGSGYIIVPEPFDKIGIQYTNGRFIITDTDGTTYYFGEEGVLDLDNLADLGKEVTEGATSGTGVMTSWKCKRIESASGVDQITFSYSKKMDTYYRSYTDYIEYYSNTSPCNLDQYFRSDHPAISDQTTYNGLLGIVPFHEISSPKYLEVQGNNPYQKFHVPYLDSQHNVVDKIYEKYAPITGSLSTVHGITVSEITFRGGKMVFHGPDQLINVRLLDGNGVETKSWNFFQSFQKALYDESSRHYNGPNFHGTSYLDSLHVKNGTNVFERYALLYNSKFCYGSHLKGHDAWGYPNESTIEIARANQLSGNTLTLPSIEKVEDRYYLDIYGGCQNYVSDININLGGGNDWAEKPKEEIMRRGVLKRIVYPTGGAVDFDFEANRYQERFVGANHQQRLPQLGGGLRLRSISYYDTGETLPSMLKYYRYGDLEEGTGIMLHRPKLTSEPLKHHFDAISHKKDIVYLVGPDNSTCNDRGCLTTKSVETKTTYRPASVLDYTYAGGAPIYYTKVTEYQQDLGEQTGKTVTEYYPPETFMHASAASLLSEVLIEGTNIPWLRSTWELGARKSESTYRYDTDERKYKPVYRERFEYVPYRRDRQVRVVYSYPKVEYRLMQGNYSGDFYDRAEEYIANQYGLPMGRLLLSKKTEERFEEDQVQTVTTSYNYDRLPYLNPSRRYRRNSRGHQIRKDFRYAYDFSGDDYTLMTSKNMVSQLVEEVETDLTEDREISRRKINYAEQPVGWNPIVPESVQTSVKGGPMETDISFDKYDQYGNVLQLTGRDKVPVSYLWGYNGLYPVAELKGVPYASIPSVYKSNTQIINPGSDASLLNLLTDLQDSFDGEQQVRLYTYKRLIGVSSETMPDGRHTYYEYDSIGRLIKEKDDQERVIRQHIYNSAGPPADFHETARYFPNTPMMRTFNYNCTPGEPQFYNYIVPGGKYNGHSMELANGFAEEEMENNGAYPFNMKCPVESEMVKVNFFAMYLTAFHHPSRMEIDFIQDGHIIATQKFKYNHVNSWPIETNFLYLPTGNYQVSFRPNANINWENNYFMDYSIEILSDEQKTRLKSGDSIQLIPGKEYQIDAVNWGITN